MTEDQNARLVAQVAALAKQQQETQGRLRLLEEWRNRVGDNPASSVGNPSGGIESLTTTHDIQALRSRMDTFTNIPDRVRELEWKILRKADPSYVSWIALVIAVTSIVMAILLNVVVCGIDGVDCS